MIRLVTSLLLIGSSVWADSVVPKRTISANQIINERDVELSSDVPNGGFSRLSDVIGQEARVVLYAGRPVSIDDVGPPAIVTRNQIVTVFFETNGLHIHTEGRALERGAVGDRIRIMNLSSRTTLFGQVQSDGSIEVQK